MRAVRLTLLSVVLVFIGAAAAAAQNTGTVTGQVTDASTGQPLSGVQMQVAGTNIGGLTDQNGRYLLTRVPSGEQQIRAVIIGYAQATETVTVSAGGTAVADFALETSAVPLEAVIVSAATGREQRARELGANVASIEVEALNPAPITSFSDALGGRSSGVVMQDVNGTTGTSQRIRIRGANSLSLSNEPLIFVDGIQYQNDFGGMGVGGQEPNRLNDINPNDIANIEIVKGPAASALYGTAAANGVILITTKRGRPGTTSFSAWVEQGSIDDITDYPDNWLAYAVLDADEPLFDDSGLFNRDDLDGDGTDGYRYCNNYSAAAGSCTQDGTLTFNTLKDSRTKPFITGNRGRYGASVRGGTEQVRYFVSAQYEDEQGVISYNKLKKGNFRANLDAELSETADLSVSFGYTDSQLSLNNNDNSIFSPIINGLTGRAYYVPPDESREFGAPVNDLNYIVWGYNQEELAYLPIYQAVDRYLTSANLRWRPTSWLTLNAQGGLDMSDTHDYRTLQPNKLPIAYSYANGFRGSERTNDYLYTALVSGVSTFELTNDLLSTTTVGSQYTLDNSENTYCYGYSLVPGTASCGTVAEGFSIDEDFFEVRTIGGYVSQELAWRDRVFLAGSLRADDNSAFGTDFKLAYYPSASLSWVVAEEPWFPQVSFLNTLRLRGAWGVSGLRPGFRQAQTLYSPTTVATPAGDRPGISLDVTGNSLLKPERTTEFEFGFDTGLFNDRITAELTYFNKKSEDALISRRLPGSLGLTTSVIDNLGSIRNQGTELAVNFSVIESQALGFNIGFTNSTLKNEVIALGEGVEDIVFNRGLQRHAEGYSAGGFWQPIIEWDDADGNGVLSTSEVTEQDTVSYIGPSLPTWQRSIFADLRLFDWMTVSTLIEGRGGHYQGNDSESFRCYLGGALGYGGCSAFANPDASLSDQARAIDYTFIGGSYGYIEKGDFYRWRELSISLRAPASLVQQFNRLEGLQLTLAGRNLALWTDYTGLDPETVEGGGNANFSQSEFNTQPPVRYLMVRLDYTF